MLGEIYEYGPPASDQWYDRITARLPTLHLMVKVAIAIMKDELHSIHLAATRTPRPRRLIVASLAPSALNTRLRPLSCQLSTVTRTNGPGGG